MKHIKVALLALLVGVLAGVGFPAEAQVTNAIVIQALEAMGLFGTGYANGQVPAWSTASRKYLPATVLSGLNPVFTGQISGPVGNCTTAPAYSFTGDLNNGWSSPSADAQCWVTAGVTRLTLTQTELTSTLPFSLPAGTAGAPTLFETGAVTTGIAFTATPSIINSISGTARTTLTATSWTAAVSVVGPAGTAAAPTYAATGATTTGLAITATPSWILGVNGVALLTGVAANVTSTVPILGPDGTVAAVGVGFSGHVGDGMFYSSGLQFANSGNAVARMVYSGSFGLSLDKDLPLSWGSSGLASLDLFLYREGANHLIQRFSTTAQRFSVANTYTSASNNELFSVDWQTTANVALVGTRTAATGTGRTFRMVAQDLSAGDVYSTFQLATSAPFGRLDRATSALGVVNSTAVGVNLFQVGGALTSTGTSSTVAFLALLPIYNQTSGTAANTDLLINRTQTAVGSGAQLLIDAQVGSASKFSVDNTGLLTTAASVQAGTNIYATAGNNFGSSTRSYFNSPLNGQVNLVTNAGTVGVGFDVLTDGTLKVRNRAQNADATISAGVFQGAGTGTSVANVGANSCGTTAATIAGNQVSGVITVGTVGGTQCRVTFTTAAPVARDCTVTDSTTTIATRATVVDTTNTDFLGAFVAGDKVTFICMVR